MCYHYLTLQHMTILAIRSTCVLSHTWEREHTAWPRTQTALPGTHDKSPFSVECVNNTSLCQHCTLYTLSRHLSFQTPTFLPQFLFSSYTHIIFSLHLFLSFFSLHMHTPAVLTSTVGIEVATICSLTQTLTRLPPWAHITKLPQTMVQWEGPLPLVGWEGELRMWGETGIEPQVARRITRTGANWSMIMVN